MNYCGVEFKSLDLREVLKTGHSFVLNFQTGREFLNIAMFRLVPPEEIGAIPIDNSRNWAALCFEQSRSKTTEIFEKNFEIGAKEIQAGPSISNVLDLPPTIKSDFVEWVKKQGYWEHDFKAYAVMMLSTLDHLEYHLRRGEIDSALTKVSEFHILVEQSEMLNFAFDSYFAGRKELAKLISFKKHKEDPKQAEKKFVFECWEAWRDNPKQYKSKAAFSRSMLEKCEHLSSSKKIEDWTREWERRGCQNFCV